MGDEHSDYSAGLAGVAAARSSVCFLDGATGQLQYRGYPVELLADRCSYEEVAHLLLFGDLPGDQHHQPRHRNSAARCGI